MATTGTVKGNLIGVYSKNDTNDDGNTDTYQLIACGTNATLNITNDMIETICKDNDGIRTILPGQQNVTINIEGLMAYDNVGRTQLFASVQNKTKLELQYGTGVVGDQKISVEAYITSFEENAPLNDHTTFSVSFDCFSMAVALFS